MWWTQSAYAVINVILVLGAGACYWIWAAPAMIWSRKGKHKKLILRSNLILTSIGAIILCVGIVALVTGQPFHVWFSPTASGFISLTCMVPMYFFIKKMYTKAELNKMSVDDLE